MDTITAAQLERLQGSLAGGGSDWKAFSRNSSPAGRRASNARVSISDPDAPAGAPRRIPTRPTSEGGDSVGDSVSPTDSPQPARAGGSLKKDAAAEEDDTFGKSLKVGLNGLLSPLAHLSTK